EREVVDDVDRRDAVALGEGGVEDVTHRNDWHRTGAPFRCGVGTAGSITAGRSGPCRWADANRTVVRSARPDYRPGPAVALRGHAPRSSRPHGRGVGRPGAPGR